MIKGRKRHRNDNLLVSSMLIVLCSRTIGYFHVKPKLIHNRHIIANPNNCYMYIKIETSFSCEKKEQNIVSIVTMKGHQGYQQSEKDLQV